MSLGIIEYFRIRQKIRKANHVARVDDCRPRRGRVVVAVCILVMALIVFEGFSITQAKYAHDRNVARNLADEATIELGLINASLISSDHVLLKEANRQYVATLAKLNMNDYIRREQKELLHSLNDYSNIIATEEKDAHLIKLHTTIAMLQDELQNIDTSKVSTKSMISIKEYFEDFRNSLESLGDEHFSEMTSKLSSYSDDLISIIEKASICVATCTEKTFATRRNELREVFEKYNQELTELDAEISSRYSPAKLIESLKVLQ